MPADRRTSNEVDADEAALQQRYANQMAVAQANLEASAAFQIAQDDAAELEARHGQTIFSIGDLLHPTKTTGQSLQVAAPTGAPVTETASDEEFLTITQEDFDRLELCPNPYVEPMPVVLECPCKGSSGHDPYITPSFRDDACGSWSASAARSQTVNSDVRAAEKEDAGQREVRRQQRDEERVRSWARTPRIPAGQKGKAVK
ncbi:hypothetical protein GGX14DRAFT_398408 [Mycena pura]|uniref:Uncharacterized protein n=1 Tax=Mycena pura TaxID=153505 RepID=A0AAD6YDK0_9AGAR|nr:hypothetical protein GGX14DRAFT_398408 [Mycena pura]